MLSWLDVQPTVVDDIITHDGPGDVEIKRCKSCSNKKSDPLYRCLECSYGLLFCGECVIKSHRALPLHRLEVCSSLSPSSRSYYPQCWKDGFFDQASLYSLGFVCHLGHEGDACPMDSQPHNLLIININGWHKLQVKFCTCGANPLSHE